MIVHNMFSANSREINYSTNVGPLLTQQDFDTDVYSLVQKFSPDELMRRSRPLAYHSDLLGNVFYDNMPEELRKSFESAYQKQKELEVKQKENSAMIKKLQEHFEAKRTGVSSPHEDFFREMFSHIEEPKKEVDPPQV